MAAQITSALAVAFDLGAETFTYELVTAAGGARMVTIAAVTDARVLLAASAKDVLQILAAAMNAVSAMGVTFAVSMGATGLVTITCTGDTFTSTLHSSAIGATLGFTTAMVNPAASRTADYQPKYLALFVSRQSGDWAQKTPMVSAQAYNGSVNGWTSATTTWGDEFTWRWIPRDLDAIAATGQVSTPWEPSPANLGSLGNHAVPWSLSDVLAVALTKSCGFTRGLFQTVRASTSTRFDVVTIDGEDVSAPRSKYQSPPWEAYRTWVMRLTRMSTPTATRA